MVEFVLELCLVMIEISIGILIGIQYNKAKNDERKELKKPWTFRFTDEPAKVIPELEQLKNSNSLWDEEWYNSETWDSEYNDLELRALLCDEEPVKVTRELLSNKEWDNLLSDVECHNIASFNNDYNNTETSAEDGYNINVVLDNLLESELEDTSNWQDEMRQDLKFYCPDVVIGRIIDRIEEIKNAD